MKRMRIIIFLITVILLTTNAGTFAADKPKYTLLVDVLDSKLSIGVDSGDVITKHIEYVNTSRSGFVFAGWRQFDNPVADVDLSKFKMETDSLKIFANYIPDKALQDYLKKETESDEKITIFLFSLVIGLTVLLIGLVVYIIIVNYKKRAETKSLGNQKSDDEKKQLRESIISVLESYNYSEGDDSRIKEWRTAIVKEAVQTAKGYTDTLLDSYQPENINYDELKKWLNEILAKRQPTLDETSNQPVCMQPQDNPKTLYANSIKDDGSFAGVSETSNENTTFELEIGSNNSAEFTVFKGNEGRILKRPELISRSVGVDMQQSGNSRLEVIPGTAEGQDGKWIVKTKAIVRTL